jgi:Flp pilus assembly protein TadD
LNAAVDTLDKVTSGQALSLRHLAGKKNASKLKDDQINAVFIARQPVFASIMADINGTEIDAAAQHQLIVGLRGMGKSTLLRRIEAELRSEAYATRFIPLAFPEEHYARVRHNYLSEFWLNCLDALANAWQEEGKESEAKRLDILIREFMRSKLDEAELAKQCKLSLDSELAKTGRRPVLLLDNFPKLVDRLPAHDWELRSWLQAAGGPMLVAASVEYPSNLSDYSAAFYDSLKTRWIGRLEAEEVMQVLRTLVEQENRPKTMLDQLAMSRPRLMALHALTGGNPRTVIYLYHLMVSGLSDDIKADLKRLMDDIDAVYEVRLNSFAEQAQQVFSALAVGWRPQSAADLKRATNLTGGGLSGQLARLEEYGLIEKSPLYKSKRTGYQVSERLFNIWYLERIGSRRDAAPVESLATFLEAFYTPATVLRVVKDLMGRRRLDDDELALMYASHQYLGGYDDDPALRDDVLYKAQLQTARLMLETNSKVSAIVKSMGTTPPSKILEFTKLEHSLQQCVPSQSSINGLAFAEAVLGSVSLLVGQAPGRIDRIYIASIGLHSESQIVELHKVFEEETRIRIEYWGEHTMLWLRTAMLEGRLTTIFDSSEWIALIRTAATERDLDVCASLIPKEQYLSRAEIYQRKIDLGFAKAGDWYNFGITLHASTTRYTEAEQAYLKAISFDTKPAPIWTNLGNLYAFKMGRLEDGEAAYKRAIEIDDKAAFPWHNLGLLIGQNHTRSADAEAAFNKAILLDSTYVNPWWGLAELYRRTGRYAEAESSLKSAISLDANNASFWNSLGNLYLDYLDRLDDAKTAYDKAMELDANNLAVRYNQIFLLRDYLGDRDSAKQLLLNSPASEEGKDTLALHHALFAAYDENWGEARRYFVTALEHAGFVLPTNTRDDWYRACAVLQRIGGADALERAISWIESAEATAKLLPLVEALQALGIGEREALQNCAAEVRPVAEEIYDEIELRVRRLPKRA